MTLDGIWAGGETPYGGWWKASQWVEQKLGRHFRMIRGRGGNGCLNTFMYNNDLKTAVAEGRIASLEINCRNDDAHGYVPYSVFQTGDARYTAAQYMTMLRERARETKALGLGANGEKHLMEIQSEADLADHYSGTSAEAREWQRLVRRIFTEEGATNVLFAASLQQGRYRDGSADEWIDLDATDIVTVDGYDKPWTYPLKDRQSFEWMFAPCRTWAKAHNKLWAVTETGVEESRTDPAYKANWYRAAGDYLSRVGDCYAVVWNYSSDGPFTGNWYFDKKTDETDCPTCWTGFTDMMALLVWKAVVNDPCAAVKAELDAANVVITQLQSRLDSATATIQAVRNLVI